MSKDRTRSIIDEKRKVLRPFNSNLTLPSTDIHEGDLRCIKYNFEWSVIIEGWLLHLTTVNLWSQAYREDFSGIQQVQKMLIGEECIVPLDCNDVENCLLTSPTIIAINALIAQNASDISDNVGDINTNTIDITNLQGRMTAAESAIAGHTLEIDQNTANNLLQDVLIDDNANAIIALQAIDVTLQSQISSLSSQITFNDSELADHEARISALEASGGGSGGSSVLATTYSLPVSSIQSIVNGVWVDAIASVQAHNFTHPNALIIYELKASHASSNNGTLRVNLNGVAGTTEIFAGASSNQPLSIQVNDVFANIPSGLLDIKLQVSSTGTYRIQNDHDIQLIIVEYSDAIEIADIINFEPDSYPHTLTVGNNGTVTANGNPDNCLSITDATNGGNYAELDIDLSAIADVGVIAADLWSNSAFNNLRVWVWLDASLIIDADKGVSAQSTWTDQVELADLTGMTGQIVTIRIGWTGTGSIECRIDNIDIEALTS